MHAAALGSPMAVPCLPPIRSPASDAVLLALLRFNFVVHSLSKGFLERGKAWDRCDLQGVGSGAFLTGGIYVYPAVYF